MGNIVKSKVEVAWCPGCGNFPVREAVLKAVAEFQAKNFVWVSGIGQAAKMPHYIETNFFNGLHGRALPAGTGIKLANPKLNVVVQSGDGCLYGEGGNHFLAAIRRNIGLTVLAHNNQVYGLTKGQASPTSEFGFHGSANPFGNLNTPFNPLVAAINLGAGFVARGFSGDVDFLASIIKEAIEYKGFALVDILTPCVSFNKVNTYKWYSERVEKVKEDYELENKEKALKTAALWGDKIPIGILYKNTKTQNLSLEEKYKNEGLFNLIESKVDEKALLASFQKY